MKTILLVDDDQHVCGMLGLALRRNGYCVIEANSGLAGLEMAQKHLPDLILSDIKMAGGDGPSLLRAIRSDPQLESRQFVFLSGAADSIPLCGIEEKADALLEKPIGLQELLGCMESRFSSSPISWRAGEVDPLIAVA